MNCTTIKTGLDCGFMTKTGCGFTSGACNTIVEQCEGCLRVMELPTGKYCSTYPNPAAKWRTGNCNFATHVKAEAQAAAAKVNPLKASKRASAKKK